MEDIKKRVAERTIDGKKKWCVVHAHPDTGSAQDASLGSVIKCFPHTSAGKSDAEKMHRAILASQAENIVRKKIVDGETMIIETKISLEKSDENAEELSSAKAGNIVKQFEFIKKNTKKRIVTAVVLKPEYVDAQGDIISAEVIEKAAHDFVIGLRKNKIGFMHKEFNRDLALVESYVAPITFNDDGKIIPKGSWVMSVKVLDDMIWNKVEEGVIKGFSIGGKANVVRKE
jgi:hypothetical protein